MSAQVKDEVETSVVGRIYRYGSYSLVVITQIVSQYHIENQDYFLIIGEQDRETSEKCWRYNSRDGRHFGDQLNTCKIVNL